MMYLSCCGKCKRVELWYKTFCLHRETTIDGGHTEIEQDNARLWLR